ncbi:hypothetical protein CKA32_002199 [Geitlerinema sp. FC II]|nr:hypothetical protein CKA32_002199 [Geitlerinema sp. FC II]
MWETGTSVIQSKGKSKSDRRSIENQGDFTYCKASPSDSTTGG